MVCNRCIDAVKDVFEELSIPYNHIELGEVTLPTPVSDNLKINLADHLEGKGFELLEDKNSQLIDRIKTLIIKSIQNLEIPDTNYSTFLEKEIAKDYTTLSTLFSSVEGVTIERFIILQKLEKVKELIIYDEKNLSQIAYLLKYSSVQHLSNQFKKSTGLTPSQFKNSHENKRIPLDQLGK